MQHPPWPHLSGPPQLYGLWGQLLAGGLEEGEPPRREHMKVGEAKGHIIDQRATNQN